MEIFYFGGDSHRLFGALTRPSGRARIGLVFCPPYGEEMTGTYSRFAAWAKLLAEQGVAVLRFHPFGTGESDGESMDFSLETLRKDTAEAVGCLRERVSVDRVGIFGLRLGASIAVRAAFSSRPDFLLLWSPVVDLAQCARELLRMKLTKELIHQQRDRVIFTREAMVKELEAGRPVDIFGFELSPALYRQMTENGTWSEDPPSPRILWLARPQERAQAEQILAGWNSRGIRVELQVLPQPIFWEEATTTMPERFIEASQVWMLHSLGLEKVAP